MAIVLCVVMLVSCWVFTAPAATAATAGNYYVEIEVYIDRNATFNRSYVGPNFTTSKDDGWKDQGGITLYYKDTNGTDTQEQYVSYGFGNKDTVPLKNVDGTITTAKHNIIGSTGTKIIADTITGFPTSFATYVMNDHYTEYAEYHISRLSIAPADDHSNLTTLWEGSCKVSNSGKGAFSSGTARYIVNWDGTASVWAPSGVSSTNFWDTDNNFVYCYAYNRGNPANEIEYLNTSTQTGSEYNEITNASVGANAATYCRAWAMPAATTITDISGDASVSVNTDDSTNTKSYTLGTVKDQYGVNWYQDSTWDTATVQNGVTFSNGTLTVPASANRSTDYTVTLNETCGNATNSKTVTINTFDYDVTFYDEDGTTVLDNRTVDYGASAPEPTATKAYDSTNHYNFAGWTGDSFTNITDGAQDKTAIASYTTVPHSLSVNGSYNDDGHTLACSGCAYTTQEAHTMSEDVDVITAPTCTASGTGTAHCEDCEYSTTVEIPATGHAYYEIYTSPTNGTAGSVCFGCNNNCGKYWTATYEDGTYTPATEYSSLAQAKRNAPASGKVNPPKFNSFYNDDINYNYAMRGASLKIAEPFGFTDRLTRQGLRFTASLHVPEGVAYTGEHDDDCVVDFGYIYSQTNNPYVNNNINNLTLDNVDRDVKKIVKMSVKDNNADKGAYDGTNWTGVSAHADTTLGGTTLTYNILINVKAYNWSENYCARAYVIYKYHGHEYTVYDNQFSSRSVEYVARAAYDDEASTQKVKNFCLNKIITPIDEGRNV